MEKPIILSRNCAAAFAFEMTKEPRLKAAMESMIEVREMLLAADDDTRASMITSLRDMSSTAPAAVKYTINLLIAQVITE